jgi:dihydrodipicolinate synthase/N-acetylneuraminate lyase
VGDDSLLLPALMARWNGVISGIACFVPELISAISRAYRSGDQSLAAAEQVKLDELIEWVVKLPIPWAVRAGLAARGIANGPMHVPPSADRIAMIQQFQNWLGPWLIEHSVVSKSA